ncbi:DUF6586 family protein [Microbulbifer hainanensis]|uniref:DUF6586 family protein n=1 Tax=Microbulbifer hainanensis TaxID=2735675 RepID=UPI001867FE2A|nr:DUF6586 family protein [Microbulbifer hainanensis]
MSNPYTGAVASALRKAELLLQAGVGDAPTRAAIQDAVVLELWRAYRAFLAELAYQLQLGVEPESARALADRASAMGKTCAEAAELCGLGADDDSWLAQLQVTWVQLWSFSSESGQRKAGGAVDLIPARNLSAPQSRVLDFATLDEWRRALAELVRRQRAHSEEW